MLNRVPRLGLTDCLYTPPLKSMDSNTIVNQSKNERLIWSCPMFTHSLVTSDRLFRGHTMDFPRHICNNTWTSSATDSTGGIDGLRCLTDYSARAWNRRNCHILR